LLVFILFVFGIGCFLTSQVVFTYAVTAEAIADYTSRLRSSVTEVKFLNNPAYLETFEFCYSGTFNDPERDKRRIEARAMSAEALAQFIPFTDAMIAAFNPHAFPALKTLLLPMGVKCRGVEMLAKHLEHWKSFTTLCFLGDGNTDSLYRYNSYAFEPKRIGRFLGLRELALENALPVNKILLHISANLTNLEKLMLCEAYDTSTHMSGFTNASIARLGALPKLTHLVLQPSTATHGVHGDAFSWLKSLQYLKVMKVSTYKNDMGFVGLSKLPMLTYLNLTYCEQVSDADLTAWSQKLHNLRCLDLSYCCHISDAGLSMLSNLKSLRLIVIKGEPYTMSTGQFFFFSFLFFSLLYSMFFRDKLSQF
jgi:hypothetical protein